MAEYIDKEKAKKILNEEYASYASPKLDEVPIADVVEVRHGKWIEFDPRNKMAVKCSNCNYAFSRLEPKNYCPNCGAKMDEEW